MFGLGKIFGGGILGRLLDSVGLGWMNNVLSLTANIMTGNWLAAAKDVFDLVSQFSNDSWQDRISRNPPLGRFGRTSGFSGDYEFSQGRLTDINDQIERAFVTIPDRLRETFSVASYTVENNADANRNLQTAHAYTRV